MKVIVVMHNVISKAEVSYSMQYIIVKCTVMSIRIIHVIHIIINIIMTYQKFHSIKLVYIMCIILT